MENLLSVLLFLLSLQDHQQKISQDQEMRVLLRLLTYIMVGASTVLGRKILRTSFKISVAGSDSKDRDGFVLYRME